MLSVEGLVVIRMQRYDGVSTVYGREFGNEFLKAKITELRINNGTTIF